jgi:hypothetical protein
LVLRTAILREERDGFPVGTEGTILLAFDDGVLLEVDDAGDRDFVMLPVPYEALTLP